MRLFFFIDVFVHRCFSSIHGYLTSVRISHMTTLNRSQKYFFDCQGRFTLNSHSKNH